MGRKKEEMDQLTIDSTNAIKAGLSYGKYIALYGHTKVQRPDKAPAGYKHICQHCGKEFILYSRHTQKYCSGECRQRYYYCRAKLPYPKEKTCLFCGKVFMAKSHREKYCGDDCNSAAQRRRFDKYRDKKAKEAMGNG
jgi:hypothetical protein